MERLPEEMVTNILSRLAVKNILQIRCVCKSWNKIISHPNFSKSQLEQSNNKTVHNRNLLILSKNSEPISVSSDYENGNDEEDCSKFTSSTLNFPVEHEDIGILSLGSCNGLLCFDIRSEIVIWNPSIRQYKILPENGSCFGPFLTHGFGYDSLSDDYKVVGVTVLDGRDVVVVNVFSLKTNSWRSFEDPSYGNFAFIYGKARNFLNGSLHWSAIVWDRDRDSDRNRNANVLFFAFSLAEEKLLEVPLPDAVDGVDTGETCVFDGCLCLSRVDKVKCGVEIWVMKEYMVKASWTLLFKLSLRPSPEFRAYCLPLYSSRDGDVILELGKRHVLKFNIKEKRFKTVIELEKNDRLQVLGYVESLVSPNFDDVQRQLL